MSAEIPTSARVRDIASDVADFGYYTQGAALERFADDYDAKAKRIEELEKQIEELESERIADRLFKELEKQESERIADRLFKLLKKIS